MKILGIGQTLSEEKRLSDVTHPNTIQLEAIRRAGYETYWVSRESARIMGANAVTDALIRSGYKPKDIGFIVAGQSNVPDFIGIDLACQVGAELGGLKIKTVNLVESCGSSISTWIIANNLMSDLPDNKVGVVLLVQRLSEPHVDRFGMMNAILSDGAVAAIVGSDSYPSSDKNCYRYAAGRDVSDTLFVDMMRIERGGSQNPSVKADHDSRHDQLGRERLMELYRFTSNDLGEFLALRAKNTIQVIQDCLNDAGWSKNDNLFLLHTLEGHQSIAAIASSLGINQQRTNASLVGEFGHVGCVDQLLSIRALQALGRLRTGDRLVTSCISGGMKWGCCLFECA